MIYLKFDRCHQPSCKRCQEGEGHGPYVYATYKEDGKTKTKYIGKPGRATTREKINQLEKKRPGALEEYREILRKGDLHG